MDSKTFDLPPPPDLIQQQSAPARSHTSGEDCEFSKLKNKNNMTRRFSFDSIDFSRPICELTNIPKPPPLITEASHSLPPFTAGLKKEISYILNAKPPEPSKSNVKSLHLNISEKKVSPKDEIKKLTNKTFIFHLSGQEICFIFTFLRRRSLCRVSQTCSQFRIASSVDLLWRPLVLQYFSSKCLEEFPPHVFGQPSTTIPDEENSDEFREACRKLFEKKVPKVYKYSKEKGWKKTFNLHLKPPTIAAPNWVWADFMVGLATVIQVSDVITDIMMLISFGTSMPPRWGYFGISCPFMLVSPCLLTYVDWGWDDGSGKDRSFLALMNFLQIRIIYESGGYYRVRYNRIQMTGKLQATNSGEVRKLETAQRKSTSQVTQIKILEAVFESMPQAMLQTYILIGDGAYSSVAIISVCLSILSVSLGFTSMVSSDDSRYAERAKWFPQVVFCFVFSGLVVRLFGYTIFAATYDWGWLLLVIGLSYKANFVQLFLWGSERKIFGLSPIFSFALMMTPMIFTPFRWAGEIKFPISWRVFNLIVLAINFFPPVIISFISLTTYTNQFMWLFKMIVQTVMTTIHIGCFAILWGNELPIVDEN